MLTIQDYTETTSLLWLYLLLYNISLLLLLSSLSQLSAPDTKTMHAINLSGLNTLFTKSITIALLSMAGVPPFVGFFSKMFIFILISNSGILFIAFTLFTLLLLSLYFYLQNVRFVNSSSASKVAYVQDSRPRLLFSHSRLALTFSTFLMFGFLITDDLLLIFIPWLLTI